MLQQILWFKPKCLPISSCKKQQKHIFVRITGLQWWFWMFGLNDLYWSILHPVSKKFPPIWVLELDIYVSTILASYIFITTAAANPTPGHRKFINFISVTLNFLLYIEKHTLTSYIVDKLLGVFFLQELDSMPCAMLLY